MTDREDLTAGSSQTETHREPHGAAAPHGAADDVPEHEMDEHGDHGAPLGPVDLPAWTAGALGVALGLVVVASLVAANGGFGA